MIVFFNFTIAADRIKHTLNSQTLITCNTPWMSSIIYRWFCVSIRWRQWNETEAKSQSFKCPVAVYSFRYTELKYF